jgi:Fimbrial assembly protein (PilN)
MIVQQVNLYQNRLEPTQRNLNLYLYVGVIILWIIILLGISLQAIKERHNQQSLVEQARLNLDGKKAQVKLLTAKLAQQKLNTALRSETKQWQKNVSELTQAIEIINNNNNLPTQGFSAYFLALANQSVSDVWLTMIHFDTRQQLIRFEGNTFNTDKIPQFLQQLQQEPVFHGRSFSTLTIEKSAENANLMIFKISTQPETALKNDAK